MPCGWYWRRLARRRLARPPTARDRCETPPRRSPAARRLRPPAVARPCAASETALLTNCADCDATSPVAPFQCRSPASSTRGSVMFQPTPTTCRFDTVSLACDTSIASLPARTSAAISLCPLACHGSGANHGRAAPASAKSRPSTRTVNGQVGSAACEIDRLRSTGHRVDRLRRRSARAAGDTRSGSCVARSSVPLASALSASRGSA